MQILQITGPECSEITEVPIPQPGPGEVLLKVLAVTTCPHWDMHILGGEPMFPGMQLDYPYTPGQPGHEACGDIEALGEGVEGLEVGQRVCAWIDPGHNVQGCYAQYVVKQQEHVVPVPAELPPEACAPLELAMCTTAHLMLAEKLDGIAGKRVGVVGLGPAGLVLIQTARAAGASEVIGLDPVGKRRALAEKLGADKTIDPTGESASQIPARHALDAFDTTFDCAGSPIAVQTAMDATRSLVVLFAVQRETYHFEPRHWPGLILAGAQAHTREAAERAAALMAEGRLDLAPLVSHTMPLADYARGVDLLRSQEATKVAFLPWA